MTAASTAPWAQEKLREGSAHDDRYRRLRSTSLRRYSPGDYEREVATPSYLDHSGVSGDVNAVFLARVSALVRGRDPSAVRILDYGCGMGKMSVYLAQQGFRNVYGFDLSRVGVAFGRELAELHGLSDHVHLAAMDAEALGFPDDCFDLVFGKAVLHHTIKYARTARELWRVMKPGARAVFKENLGNNPLLRLGRFYTMHLRGQHGDVNITSKMLAQYACRFSSVEVEAYHCFYMAKRLFWRAGEQAAWRKATMRLLKWLDDHSVHRVPALREMLCGDAIFTLVK